MYCENLPIFNSPKDLPSIETLREQLLTQLNWDIFEKMQIKENGFVIKSPDIFDEHIADALRQVFIQSTCISIDLKKSQVKKLKKKIKLIYEKLYPKFFDSQNVNMIFDIDNKKANFMISNTKSSKKKSHKSTQDKCKGIIQNLVEILKSKSHWIAYFKNESQIISIVKKLNKLPTIFLECELVDEDKKFYRYSVTLYSNDETSDDLKEVDAKFEEYMEEEETNSLSEFGIDDQVNSFIEFFQDFDPDNEETPDQEISEQIAKKFKRGHIFYYNLNVDQEQITLSGPTGY